MNMVDGAPVKQECPDCAPKLYRASGKDGEAILSSVPIHGAET